MYALLVFLAIGISAAVGSPLVQSQRIVGGEETTIEQHPHQVSLLGTWTFETYVHNCGGSIINSRSVLTAAHCAVFGIEHLRFRVRAGSSSNEEGGTVHNVRVFIPHPQYRDRPSIDNDIAIVRVETFFVYSSSVQPIMIAGPNYAVPDGAEVWASGWGDTEFAGTGPEILHHVNTWVINQVICRTRYDGMAFVEVTENMICVGDLDVGGRNQCQGDSGGPLTHNGVLVGLTSWAFECGHPMFPGVNTRVSRYTNWIQANA